jgi:alpha-tubulin suppressor-like RCC1 family protein
VSVAAAAIACDTAQQPAAPQHPTLAGIVIDQPGLVLERAARTTLSATVTSTSGEPVDAPIVWRSADEQIASFAFGGVLLARQAGLTTVTASSAGVQSAPVSVQVVWTGPATITRGNWSAPVALNPGATLHDSVRVIVNNAAGAPVGRSRVAFTITSGGGTISPAVATTDVNGTAAAQWTLGPEIGPNTVTAAVVRDDGSLDSLVAQNAVSFSLTSYRALLVQSGSGQTRQILSTLPVNPSVRVVDSLGAPRRGVPVLFTAFGGGHVEFPLVSSGADGVASPGAWTLGDAPGDQALSATAEDAIVSVHATATGTPIYYRADTVVSGAASTCAIRIDGTVDCWGESPANGNGEAATATPTTVNGELIAASLGGGSAHFCALTAEGVAWCWGDSAGLDTTGRLTNPIAPTPVSTTLRWRQITTGGSHNCAIAADQSAWCWGMNSAGQLGARDTIRRVEPTPVSGAFAFSQISAGTSHTCGLTGDGAAFCWGANSSGQLGDGTSVGRSTPTAVAGGLRFQTIRAGDASSCALTITGRIYCWGLLGGSTQRIPTLYASPHPFVALTVGGGHACALEADGTARCWGDNSSGQLGDSTLVSRATPTLVAGGLAFSQLSSGQRHTCARTVAGDVACWGFNGSGELGDRNTALRSVPHLIVLGVNP